MLARTHVGVGVAAALSALHPVGVASCAVCVMGAAVGSQICDIDVRASERQRDAFRWHMTVLVLCCILLAYDYGRGGMVCSYVVEHLGTSTVAGIVGFLATCVYGALSPHRGFAHSLAALALWSGSLSLICPALVAPFAVGVASHLLLDLVNKKGLTIFWPLSTKVSLGLFKADGLVNDLLAMAGVAVSAVLLVGAVGA